MSVYADVMSICHRQLLILLLPLHLRPGNECEAAFSDSIVMLQPLARRFVSECGCSPLGLQLVAYMLRGTLKQRKWQELLNQLVLLNSHSTLRVRPWILQLDQSGSLLLTGACKDGSWMQMLTNDPACTFVQHCSKDFLFLHTARACASPIVKVLACLPA